MQSQLPCLSQNIRRLRLQRGLSQEALARALSVSAQAVSKWETDKALPDIALLPPLAALFHVSLDELFFGTPAEEPANLPEETQDKLLHNRSAWDDVAKDWHGTTLPSWGPYTPTEQDLHLFDGLEGKSLLELACGSGRSLLYAAQHGASALYGLDISPSQLEKARILLEENHVQATLFLSPMELDPGLPPRHFDCVYSVYGLGWTQDLSRTISLVASYLKPGGSFIFSWDNPIIPCLEAKDGQYVLSKSYVDEFDFHIGRPHQTPRLLKNWKLSSYINCLAEHGFQVERLVEASAGADLKAPFTQKYYDPYKATLIHHTFIIKARLLRSPAFRG